LSNSNLFQGRLEVSLGSMKIFISAIRYPSAPSQ
jgi:hypothetical protein